MGAIAEVATFLGTVSPTLGTIKKGTALPATPDVVLAVTEFPGGPSAGAFGHAGIKYELTGIQLRARGAKNDENAARALLHRARHEFAKVQAQTLSGTYYLTVTTQGGIFPLMLDDDERPVVAANFLVEKEESAT